MDLTHYILNKDHSIQPVDINTWARWIKEEGHERRRVALDEDEHHYISTVFLGLDHNFGNGAPVLFETMVFGKTPDGHVDYMDKAMDRYSTYDEARAGHRALVRVWLKRTWKAWLNGFFTRSR